MAALIHEKVWVDKKQYDEAERQYYERLAKLQNDNGSPDPEIPRLIPISIFAPDSQISKITDSTILEKSKETDISPSVLLNSPIKARKSKKEKAKKLAAKRLAEQAALIDEPLLKNDVHTSPSSSEKEVDNKFFYELEKECKKTTKKGKKGLKVDKVIKGHERNQAEKEIKMLKDKKDKQKQVHDKLVRYNIEDSDKTKQNPTFLNIFQMKIDGSIKEDDEKNKKVLEDEKGSEINVHKGLPETRSCNKESATDPNIFYFVQCYDDNITVKMESEKEQTTKDDKEQQKKKWDKNAKQNVNAVKYSDMVKNFQNEENSIEDTKKQERNEGDFNVLQNVTDKMCQSRQLTVHTKGDAGAKANIEKLAAMQLFQEKHVGTIFMGGDSTVAGQSGLANEVAKARQHIKNSLECMDSVAALAGVPNVELVSKISHLEKENADLKVVVEELRKLVLGVQQRVGSLEARLGGGAVATASVPSKPVAPAPAKAEESDDGVDLFGSDSEDEGEEANKIREARLAAYAAKKSKKPVLIAKSNIILDVKPWDDETDMKVLEAEVRKVSADGLLWGASKLVPLAYGIHKLQISCVVEDDKISVDWLQETLELIEDYPVAPAPAKAEESDDGVDLFGSDSEDEGEEANKIREARLAAYAAKKSKKPVLIAKSNIILDVKPWDDETDMKVLEAEVRKVSADGLLWGASKLVPLAYGIHKLQISCVVEDDKISVDWLQETLELIEDYVQSVDIAAFNKV